MILTNAILTAYCSCSICCGSHASVGITASGAKPKAGLTIATSRSIPLGSHVLISGHDYIVQDRLAKRFDKRFDIYFSIHKEALKFGKKTNMTVNIITKLPMTK